MEMRRNIIISLILIALLAFGAGFGTYAWFTSQSAMTTKEIKAGTLKLEDLGSFEEYDLGEIVSNMAPGDETDEVSILIENAGTLDLAWFGRFVAVPSYSRLLEALYIKEAKMEFLDPNDNSWENTDDFIKNGTGHGDDDWWYTQLANNDPMGVISLKTWMTNNNAMGAGHGVQIGALRPGYKYRFTFKLGFAEEADNKYQGDKTSPVKLKYVVNATQVNKDALAALDAKHEEYSGLENLINWLEAQLDKQQ